MLDVKTIITEAAMASKQSSSSEDTTKNIEDMEPVVETPVEEISEETEEISEETGETTEALTETEENIARIDNSRKMPKVYEEIQGEYFAWDINTEQQITIEDIKDEQGYLSQKIQELLDKYDIRTIPLQVTDILPQVTELKEHDLVSVDGVLYAMNRDYDKGRIIRYRDAIAASLKSGLPFKKSLLVDVELESGDIFKTLDLTQTEWNFVCSLFRKYNPRLIITEDNDFILLVG